MHIRSEREFDRKKQFSFLAQPLKINKFISVYWNSIFVFTFYAHSTLRVYFFNTVNE